MFDEWEDWYSRKRLRAVGRVPAASSLRSKRSHLGLAASKVSVNCDAKNLAVALADREFCEDLLDDLLATRSATYVRGLCFTLLSFGEWASKAHGISCALSKRDIPHVVYTPETDSYSPGDLDQLVTASKMNGLRFHMFVVTLVDTGRRLNEVLSIRYEDLRLEHVVPHVVLDATKTNQTQLVPLSARLQSLYSAENLAHLRTGADLSQQTVRDPATYLFPWCDTNASKRFVKMCKLMGIDNHAVKGVRTAFITNRLAAGAPINGVAKLVGHNSLAMISKHYDRTNSLNFAYLL